MSGDRLDLDAIEARANAAAGNASGRRWVVEESPIIGVDVRANLGAGPTVCSTIPLGYDIRRANAAHIAGMDPATTLALVTEVRRLRGQVENLDKWLTAANDVIRDRAIDESYAAVAGNCGWRDGCTCGGRSACPACIEATS